MSSFVPSAITQPFFELQTPDFAWKFVWIVQKITKVQKQVCKYKSTHNSVTFSATDSRFCMEVRMDSPKNYKSTKKYKSTKVLITQSFLEQQTPDFAWKIICTVQPNEKVQKVQKYKNRKVQKYKIEKYKNTKTKKGQKCKENAHLKT